MGFPFTLFKNGASWVRQIMNVDSRLIVKFVLNRRIRTDGLVTHASKPNFFLLGLDRQFEHVAMDHFVLVVGHRRCFLLNVDKASACVTKPFLQSFACCPGNVVASM